MSTRTPRSRRARRAGRDHTGAAAKPAPPRAALERQRLTPEEVDHRLQLADWYEGVRAEPGRKNRRDQEGAGATFESQLADEGVAAATVRKIISGIHNLESQGLTAVEARRTLRKMLLTVGDRKTYDWTRLPPARRQAVVEKGIPERPGSRKFVPFPEVSTRRFEEFVQEQLRHGEGGSRQAGEPRKLAIVELLEVSQDLLARLPDLRKRVMKEDASSVKAELVDRVERLAEELGALSQSLGLWIVYD